jgi:hypothetical protein
MTPSEDAGDGAGDRSRPLSAAEIEGACAFLSGQAATLIAGLRAVETPVQESALASHEASHETWVRLLAAVNRAPAEELCGDLTALYEFQGRLAASLERGLDGWFSIEAAREVRGVLAEQLASCTVAAVEGLRSLLPRDVAGGDGLRAPAAV